MAVRPDRAAAAAALSTTDIPSRLTPVVPLISIIIPVLNDREALAALLSALQPLRAEGHEVLVVDGGSTDGSMTVGRQLADRLMMGGRGRALQMNLGAEFARHDILWFLHADTRLPDNPVPAIQAALAQPERHWGRFDVRLDATGGSYAVIAFMMNLRSRLSGVATGDQGLFVRKQAFHEVDGYREIPLMEDVALSKSLRRLSWPVCLSERLVTSARRWQQQGVVSTVLMMWRLRLAYFLGADPHDLVRRYYPDHD